MRMTGIQLFCWLLLQKEIKEHRDTLNPEAPRDFLDAFLIEMASSAEDFTGKIASEVLHLTGNPTKSYLLQQVIDIKQFTEDIRPPD